MNKQDVLNRVKELGLLAVIRGPSEDLTVRTIEALVKGGVFGIEVTFSTPNAYSVVERVKAMFGDQIVLGMGTLTEVEQVEGAKSRGAQFIVSPMYDEELCKAMVESGLITMIGSLTPSEVFRAYQSGADVIKIFPGRLGGPNYIKDLRAPFPNIPFMPTGGVDASNAADWFKAGVIAVGAGSNLCPKDKVIKEEFEEITQIAREFVKVINEARQA